MLIKIAAVLGVLIVIFLIAAAFQPSDFRVMRSTSISAPPAVAFAQINDLHRWQEISPYAKLDPAAKYTFEGPAAGTGASLAWAGNARIGAGRMTIIDSRRDELVRMKLEFVKPFTSTCEAEFTFKAGGGQTLVTWSMAGPKNFVSKAMGLVMNMDRMIGTQFEDGLASLKTKSEAIARQPR